MRSKKTCTPVKTEHDHAAGIQEHADPSPAADATLNENLVMILKEKTFPDELLQQKEYLAR